MSTCQRARSAPRVALDTEFIRTRTYYPQLGLIQLYDGETVTLIDPLAIKNWAPFKALLIDQQVLKFLHASSEDLEVFLNIFELLPTPFLDTQILAAFAGHSLSSGFSTVVAHYLQIQLDKSASRTDWLARPLTAAQYAYATADVFYLLPLADQLFKECQQRGWLAAATNECELLAQRRCNVLQPEIAYQHINHAWQLRRRQLECLRRLAAWRLTTAREKDLAVNFVVREENLWKVARYQPTSLFELNRLGLNSLEVRHHGHVLLDLVKQAQATPEEQLPTELTRLADHHGYKHAFKAVKDQIQLVANSHDLNSELLASRRQINQFLQWLWHEDCPHNEPPELLSGWRADLLSNVLTSDLIP